MDSNRFCGRESRLFGVDTNVFKKINKAYTQHAARLVTSPLRIPAFLSRCLPHVHRQRQVITVVAMHRRTTRWHDGLSDASSLNATIAQPSPLAWIDHIGEEAVALGVHQDADEAIAALHGATDDERSRCRTWPQVVRQASRRVSRQVKQEECGGTVRHHARVRLLEEAAALLTVGQARWRFCLRGWLALTWSAAKQSPSASVSSAALNTIDVA